jgi:outer membrane cobalamin receptor
VASGAVETVPEEEIFPGDPIVITAIGEPARESEVPFGIRSLTAYDFYLAGASDLAEGLARAEGMHVREYGGSGSARTISTRGSYAKQTLVMVDGQPINNHQGGDVDFNAVSLEDLERVEVMAGPSSALYGANATAGVVNVVTRGVPDEPGLSFRGDYGTHNELNTELAAGAPFGWAGVNVGGNYRRGDGFRENDDFTGTGGHLKLSAAAGEEATLWVRGQYQTSELGVPGSLTYPSPLARQEDDFATANVGFDGSPGDRISLTGRAYYKNQRRHYADPDPVFPIDDTHENDAFGGRAVAFYQLLAWNRLGVGGEYQQDKTDSTAIGVRDGSSWAAFLQEDLRFGGLTTVAGVRYDSSSIYGGTTSPRLGVRYRFNDYVSARAAAGRGFRAPTFDELYWPDTGFGGGNPDLKPEYCWTYEAGPAFRLAERLTAEATYFYSTYDDLIAGWPPENVARGLVQGLEASVEAAPLAAAPNAAVVLSGTYLNAEDRDTGEELDYRPAYSGFAEVRYRHEFAGGGLALTPSLSAEFVGRQQYSYFDAGAGRTVKRWLDGYALLNARLAFKIYYPELFVAGKNLAGEEYQTVYDYPMPGRTFTGGVSVSF